MAVNVSEKVRKWRCPKCGEQSLELPPDQCPANHWTEWSVACEECEAGWLVGFLQDFWHWHDHRNREEAKARKGAAIKLINRTLARRSIRLPVASGAQIEGGQMVVDRKGRAVPAQTLAENRADYFNKAQRAAIESGPSAAESAPPARPRRVWYGPNEED